MNAIISGFEEDEVLCFCSGTTKEHMQKLINEGFNDIEILSRVTGAVSGCGACEDVIVAMLL